jgi:exopolysaccharide production protein ExoY
MRQTALVGPAGRYAAPEWTRMQAVAMDRRLDGRSSSRPAEMVIKRGLDVLLASILLVLLLPGMLLIAALVRRDGGPAVFGHRRIGADGRTFRCWKFRSMVRDADTVLAQLLERDATARSEWEREYKLRDDPRITPVGKILRVTSLDELPQLINVIKGEMSLVGPRPIVSDEIKRYGNAFHDYRRCRPGITGKWQVSGRNDIDYGTRVRLDQDYARRWSLGRDLMILLKTVQVVIQKKGAR